MERLRVGIAGAGFVAGLHARAAMLAGAQLAGIAASTEASAQRAATELGFERAYPSPEALATDPSIDVVHVCTPNHLHAPLARAALDAGKHVICEKPLSLDAASALELTRAAERSPVIDAVPFVYRFYPTVREARERVRAGVTGRVHLLHGTYLQDWLLRAEDDNWRVDAELGGASRAFADIGSHWCDLAEFVSGHRITRLCARILTAVPERVAAGPRRAFSPVDAAGELRAVATEDAAVVQFETDGGALGSLVVSQVSAGRKNRLWLELDGAEAALAFDQETPDVLWQGTRETATLIQRDPLHLSAAARRLARLPAGHPEGYASCFDAFVADAYTAVRGEEEPDGLPRFADGLRTVQITEAVLASAAGQRWVELPGAGG